MFEKNKKFIVYGLSFGLIALLLKWFEMRFMFVDQSLELYIGAVALIFTALGIWTAIKLTSSKVQEVIIEEQHDKTFSINTKELQSLNLSRRELEVLQLMSIGNSNQEIADALFISLNTVKTHAAQIFEKMEVKRRTQAVDKAKRLNIIS